MDFETLTQGYSVAVVDAMFNEAYQSPGALFSDAQTRRACLAQMRTNYGRKMLEACAISPSSLARLSDPAYLPSRAEVLECFQLDFGPSSSSSSSSSSSGGRRDSSGSRVAANMAANMEAMERFSALAAAERSFVENYWLEFGPATFSALFSFCEDHEIYEVYTQEYVAALREQLAERHAALPSDLRDRPLLDVAAGSGRLAHLLNSTEDGGTGSAFPRVVAADDGSWALKQAFPTIDLSHEQAVEQLEPAIVLCCWMPENTDFTAALRRAPSVCEYLLVGPAESGLSGLPWETWGHVPPYLQPGWITAEELAAMSDADPKKKTLLSFQAGCDATQRGEPPPFAADGFDKQRLGSLSALQICRRDCSPDAFGHSETISFTRTR